VEAWTILSVGREVVSGEGGYQWKGGIVSGENFNLEVDNGVVVSVEVVRGGGEVFSREGKLIKWSWET